MRTDEFADSAEAARRGQRPDATVPEAAGGHGVELPAVLTPKEVAGYLRVSVWAIYDAVNAGTLPAIRIGRAIRIPRRAVVVDDGGASPSSGA